MRYPFSPEVLDALPEELAELFRSLEETLLDEICSRLKLAGELNEVTVQDIRALRSHGIGLKEIERAIQRTANISEQRLNRLLEDVVERNQRYYKEVIDIGKRYGYCRDYGAGTKRGQQPDPIHGLSGGQWADDADTSPCLSMGAG